jgi:hypothetical protein
MCACRNANSSWLGKTLQSGSNVHSVSEEVASTYHYVTNMNTDAELQAALSGLVLVQGSQRLLNLDSASGSIDGAGELREHAVPSRVGDPATMFIDEPVHDLAMLGQAPESCILILAHQARVTRHVSREEGCQPPLDPMFQVSHGSLGAVEDVF